MAAREMVSSRWSPPPTQVMLVGMGSVGPDVAPVRKDIAASSIFFIAWVFTGSFFAMNLFVGVIVDNFNKIQKESSQSAINTCAECSECGE